MNNELIFVENDMSNDIHNIIFYNSFKTLEIYFNKKSVEDKERILRDALFGC